MCYRVSPIDVYTLAFTLNQPPSNVSKNSQGPGLMQAAPQTSEPWGPRGGERQSVAQTPGGWPFAHRVLLETARNRNPPLVDNHLIWTGCWVVWSLAAEANVRDVRRQLSGGMVHEVENFQFDTAGLTSTHRRGSRTCHREKVLGSLSLWSCQWQEAASRYGNTSCKPSTFM